jgi:hypothetical protein
MKMERVALKRIYTDPWLINLPDLPKDRWAPATEKAVH